MLARRHAADLRRARVIASLVLAGFVALLGYAWFVVWQWSSAWTWVGALMITLGVVPISVGVASWIRVVSLSLVFDRSVGGADDISYPERERLRMRLTRNLAEVDAVLIELGEQPLETYLELNLASGIARHDPRSRARVSSGCWPRVGIGSTRRPAVRSRGSRGCSRSRPSKARGFV